MPSRRDTPTETATSTWRDLPGCISTEIRRRLGCAFDGKCRDMASWEEAHPGGCRYWCTLHAHTHPQRTDEVLRVSRGDGPALRPHTIPGWWQVWSGYICIALLTPEDVAPIAAAARESVLDR